VDGASRNLGACLTKAAGAEAPLSTFHERRKRIVGR